MQNPSQLPPHRMKALFLARQQLSELVYDVVQLEGINYTLPEVQTLLDGVTVGGHRLSDERITLNQAATWKQLFAMVHAGTFALTKKTVCDLHATAAFEESLFPGEFRTGSVTISGTQYMPPPATVAHSKCTVEHGKAALKYAKIPRSQYIIRS